MLVVEPARGGDWAGVARLAAQNLSEPADPDLMARGARIWVARDVASNRVVGFAAAERDDACEGHVVGLAVTPALRSRGIGGALLRTVRREMAIEGAMRLRLEVRADDQESQRFYVRHGFAPSGLHPHAYQDGADAISMERPL